MKIAQIAPLIECCPPPLYGGTERIVSYLTEELVAEGHEVTLFASGDSQTSARLVPCSRQALRADDRIKDYLPYLLVMLDTVMRRAAEFDILHFHIDMVHFPLVRDIAARTLTTMHGRLDLPDMYPFYQSFPEIPLVSVSHHQQLPMPANVTWAGTVHHGLPANLLPFSPEAKGGYLAFLGRISPDKRPDLAIAIAAQAGLKLKIAAKIDRAEQSYWDDVIEPLVKAHPNVEFIGEIDEQQKAAFLGDALALLFPIQWPEPFGLVMIEAMACGTPVIAFNAGAVPEVITDGITGFVVADVAGAVDAVRRLPSLDRRQIRASFEKDFTARRMAEDYLAIYRQAMRKGSLETPLAAATRPVLRSV